MDKNQFDFNLPEGDKRSKAGVYIKISILPIIVYATFVLGFLGVIKLGISLSAIILTGLMLIVALFFTKHSAEYGCFLFEGQKDEFKKELKSFILKSLLTIGKDTKSNASFDDFIQDYTKFVRNDNYASVGAGIFSMLGILGTFISIAVSMPSLSAPSDISFEGGISELLANVGSAFYIATYGIFLSLWWIFFERFGMSRFKKLVNRQKLVTKSFFWSKEELEERYMQEGIQSFSKISTIFGYVSNQEFFNELDHIIERKFENFTNMIKIEENAIKLSNEHIKQTMASLVKSQKEQRDIVRVHSDILNVLNSFNKNIKDMQLSFSEHYVRLHTISDEKIGRFEKAVSGLGANISAFESNLEKFSTEILDKQQLALDGFKAGMVDGMYAFRQAFDEENKSANETLAMLDELKQDIADIDSQANLALNNIENTIKYSQSDFGESKQEQIQKLDAINNSFEGKTAKDINQDGLNAINELENNEQINEIKYDKEDNQSEQNWQDEQDARLEDKQKQDLEQDNDIK